MQAVTSDLLRKRARAALDSCPPGSLAPEARAGTKCLGLPRATENITHVLHYLKASGSCILVGRPFSGQAAIASTVSLLMKATLVTTLWRKGITAAELHEQVAGAVRAAGAGTVLLYADQNLTAKDELLGVLHDTIQHLNVNAASGNRLLQGAKLNNLRILMEMSTERYHGDGRPVPRARGRLWGAVHAGGRRQRDVLQQLVHHQEPDMSPSGDLS